MNLTSFQLIRELSVLDHEARKLKKEEYAKSGKYSAIVIASAIGGLAQLNHYSTKLLREHFEKFSCVN